MVKKYQDSMWGKRRKAGKCKGCKQGQVWEYEAVGFLSKAKKCDLCGDSQEDY